MLQIYEPVLPYNGKRVTISFPKDQILWPSDSTMPLGRPGASEFKVLKVH